MPWAMPKQALRRQREQTSQAIEKPSERARGGRAGGAAQTTMGHRRITVIHPVSWTWPGRLVDAVDAGCKAR